MKAFATAVLLAGSAAVFAQQTGQSQPSTNTPDRTSQSQQSQTQQQNQGQQTFTGCLTSANGVFSLTVADPPLPGATAQNTAFTLKPSGDVDLKSQVNHKVEVKGTAGSTDDAARVAERTSSQATGTTGSNGSTSRNTGTATPRVETSAKAQIVARTLTVSSVREVASKCDPLAK
jgi:hypothetical protein